MPLIQMTFKREKSLEWTANRIMFFFIFFFPFHTVQGRWLKTNQMCQNTLCMDSGVMYASFGMKETGRTPTWLASGVAECCVEELFT